MDIKSYKENKSRGASVKDVIDSLKECEHKTESIAVVVMYSDGEIETAYSTENNVELIGLLDIAKIELTNDILSD